jgi:hypothetical protein
MFAKNDIEREILDILITHLKNGEGDEVNILSFFDDLPVKEVRGGVLYLKKMGFIECSDENIEENIFLCSLTEKGIQYYESLDLEEGSISKLSQFLENIKNIMESGKAISITVFALIAGFLGMEGERVMDMTKDSISFFQASIGEWEIPDKKSPLLQQNMQEKVLASPHPIQKKGNISLVSRGKNTVEWNLEGSLDYSHGVKIVWGRESLPTYPGPNNALYISNPQERKSILTPENGEGEYFVRVCRYLGNGKCGEYSNQLVLYLYD